MSDVAAAKSFLDSSDDVLDDLRKWASLKVGDPMPNQWGPSLTAVLNRAIAEIERLRDGS
jgi:hypothetical protein